VGHLSDRSVQKKLPREGERFRSCKGGHYLVNWQTCMRPMKWGGGLRLKDLEKFGRPLRLCWLWHKWDCRDRHWKDMLKVCDPLDKDIFLCSTYIQIGDGKNTPFWEAKWL
jgi:hypothetical protein